MSAVETSKNAGRVLDQAEVLKMLGETRTRGDYDVILDEFHASNEIGVEVALGEGSLAGKDAMNVYTGLNNAKKKQNKEGALVREWGPSIKVIKKNLAAKGEPKDEHVFLINTALVEGVDPESVDESPDENTGTEEAV